MSSGEEERVSDDFDVVIVGAGPSGLSAAIKLKQMQEELRVVVVEKASEVGGHTLSGAVIETRSLDELLPEWRDMGAPVTQEAGKDSFVFLPNEKSSITSPITPRPMHNEGNYIVRLGHVVAWLGEQAEELGVEIYPGIAASEVLYNDAGAVAGIRTADVGVGKDGKRKPTYEAGMDLMGKMTLFGEGSRGSLTLDLEDKFGLRKDCQHQTYGLGLKELWEIDPSKHKPGTIQHTVGWPAPSDTYAGSWLYHLEDDGKPLVSVGYVVGLDFKNPHLSPYKEFQRLKHHPLFSSVLEGGERLQYGARTIVEGGFQSVPTLSFPGGALVGDTAGFLNVPKIKGTHTAMKSGILAAEAVVDALSKGEAEPASLQERYKGSWLYDELHRERNVRPGFHYGLYAGLALAGIDQYLFFGKAPWTLKHQKPDHACREPASSQPRIDYPKPDGKISFDLLTNLQLSGVYHEEDQPIHLEVRDEALQKSTYAKSEGTEVNLCPAGVYEFVDDELVRNAQNCVHCKCCSIAFPGDEKKPYIKWNVPEGGGGPNYDGM